MISLKANKQYLLLDLGSEHVDELLREEFFTASLEVKRQEDQEYPYSRYYVRKMIPCTFRRGKLYKV